MNRSTTLTQQIKQKITCRIISGSLLFIAMFCAMTIYDAYENYKRINKSTSFKTAELSEYITSQKLIGNDQAIYARLKNISHGVIKYEWIKPDEANFSSNDNFNKLLLHSVFNWIFIHPIPLIGLENIGYIKASGSLINDADMLYNFFFRGSILLLFFIWMLIILYPLSRKIPEELFVEPVRKILHLLDESQLDVNSSKIAIPLAVELQSIQTELLNLIEKSKEESQKEAFLTIATQVAHDIRSPLAAINTALFDLSSLQECKRVLIKSATKRINDIANNLLLHSKKYKNMFQNEVSLVNSSELVFTILQNIILEKNFEYSKSNVQMELIISSDTYDNFANLNISLFQGVLSNLINNSMESIKDEGLIIISLHNSKNNIIIDITDNGCGIPENLISKITYPGYSYNKPNGAGCGLSNAKQYIEQLNGKLSIESSVDIGTKVLIELPRATTPNWFCNTILLNNYKNIVIVDDDFMIHDIWNKKFKNYSYIEIIHFNRASDLNVNVLADLELNATLFLIDYEFINETLNGLDLIEDLNLSNNSYLVTGAFEEDNLRERCNSLSVQIIPKNYVPYIPIEKTSLASNHIILIDNDEMIRTMWTFAAEDRGLDISTYSSYSDFVVDFDKFHKDTPIYIDSNLGEQTKGEEYAKKLYDQGFKELYITTGYQRYSFNEMPWIKSVLGKDVPF